jgi:hypothetical protein
VREAVSNAITHRDYGRTELVRVSIGRARSGLHRGRCHRDHQSRGVSERRDLRFAPFGGALLRAYRRGDCLVPHDALGL